MAKYVDPRLVKCAVCGRQKKVQLQTLHDWTVCTECIEWMDIRHYTQSERRSFILKALELYPV